MKKSQIKMGETIAVLIVFFILFMVGMVFYAKFKQDTIEEERERADTLRKIGTAIRVSRLPELQCTTTGIERGNTLDLIKLNSLKEWVEDEQQFRSAYYDLFYTSEIVIEQVYPTEKEWVLYNYTGNKSSVEPVYVPVTIHDPVEDTYSFGYIRVGAYV